MDENESRIPATSLNDAQLDEAAGGDSDGRFECRDCHERYPLVYCLGGGYCPDCYPKHVIPLPSPGRLPYSDWMK